VIISRLVIQIRCERKFFDRYGIKCIRLLRFLGVRGVHDGGALAKGWHTAVPVGAAAPGFDPKAAGLESGRDVVLVDVALGETVFAVSNQINSPQTLKRH